MGSLVRFFAHDRTNHFAEVFVTGATLGTAGFIVQLITGNGDALQRCSRSCFSITTSMGSDDDDNDVCNGASSKNNKGTVQQR